MGTHYRRHISRLASHSGVTTKGEDLMDLITFDKDYTNPKIFKLQIMVEQNCEVTINGKSKMTIDQRYGLTLDYTDLDVESFIFDTDQIPYYVVVGY